MVWNTDYPWGKAVTQESVDTVIQWILVKESSLSFRAIQKIPEFLKNLRKHVIINIGF